MPVKGLSLRCSWYCGLLLYSQTCWGSLQVFPVSYRGHVSWHSVSVAKIGLGEGVWRVLGRRGTRSDNREAINRLRGLGRDMEALERIWGLGNSVTAGGDLWPRRLYWKFGKICEVVLNILISYPRRSYQIKNHGVYLRLSTSTIFYLLYTSRFGYLTGKQSEFPISVEQNTEPRYFY